MKSTSFVYDPIYTQHLTGEFHPEQPARYEVIMEMIKKEGLDKKCGTITPRKAEIADLLLCHTSAYIEIVREDAERCAQLGQEDGSFTLRTGDVQICPASYEVALWAVGGGLSGVDAVMKNEAQNVFAIVRPPGHHACSNMGMGFCLFNNVAVGARYAQKKYGVERVLIVDWDVHHGNGTQEIFYNDPSVFYFSTHQSPFYPGTGRAEEQGIARNILNIPIAGGEESRNKVLQAFEGPLLKAMAAFKPQLVLISAGFDAYENDPIGGFNFKAEDFGTLTQIVKRIAQQYAQGRIISVLEGGYDLKGLYLSAYHHVNGLLSI